MESEFMRFLRESGVPDDVRAAIQAEIDRVVSEQTEMLREANEGWRRHYEALIAALAFRGIRPTVLRRAAPGTLVLRNVYRIDESGQRNLIEGISALKPGELFTLDGTEEGDEENGTGIYRAITESYPCAPDGNWAVEVDTICKPMVFPKGSRPC